MNIDKSNDISECETLYEINLNLVKYRDIHMKSLVEICKRFIANLLAIQVGLEFINKVEEIDRSISFFDVLLDVYDVRENLFKMEKKAFYKELTEKECFELVSQCECLSVLAWVLGLIDDIGPDCGDCDINELMVFVAKCKGFDSFVKTCNLRGVKDILKQADFYLAVDVKERIDGYYPGVKLNPNIILERSRAFHWLFSSVSDWNNLSLHT